MQSAATIASQSPLASSRRSWEPRWREPSALSTRPDRFGSGAARRRPGACAGARAEPPVSFAFGAHSPPAFSWGASGFEFARLFEVGKSGGVVAGARLDPRAQGIELPVAFLAFDRLAEPLGGEVVFALALGDQAELQVGRGGPGLDRAGGVGVVDGAGDVCRRRRRACWIRSRVRPAAGRPGRSPRSRRGRRRRPRSRSSAPCGRSRPGAARSARSAPRPAPRRRGRRRRPARRSPRTSRSRPRSRRSASPRRAPRGPRAGAPAAARQADMPIQSSDPIRPRTISPPTRPSSANASR